MACEGYSKAQVWFKYGDGDWTVFTGNETPITTSCSLSSTRSNNQKYYATFAYRTGRGIPADAACNQIKWGISQPEYYAPFDAWEFTLIYRDWYLSIYDQGNSKDRRQVFGNTGLTLVYYGSGCPGSTVADWAYEVFPDTVTWHRADNGQDPTVATFKILDNAGNILYQQNSAECPQVEIKCGETCPPETCCECTNANNTVCCYGSDGTVIYSYQQ